MSDTSNVDNEQEPVEKLPTVAPAPGESQGSTPAPGDTPAPPDEPKVEETEKQSRRDARAFATLRRENRELYRRLGGLEAMLQQTKQQNPPVEGTIPQRQDPPPVNDAVEELNRSILEKIEDAGEDYEAVVEKISAPTFPISVAMRDYLATSEKPAQVAKLLADDPKEARRISLLSDRAADRAMEQLEAKTRAAAPRVTKAPPPPRTVGGSSSVRPDPAKMSMEEYAEWRLKRPS